MHLVEFHQPPIDLVGEPEGSPPRQRAADYDVSYRRLLDEHPECDPTTWPRVPTPSPPPDCPLIAAEASRILVEVTEDLDITEGGELGPDAVHSVEKVG